MNSDVDINSLPNVHVGNSTAFRLNSVNRGKLEDQITHELNCGNYVTCNQKPRIVSAINSVPKPNGSVWLIHDLSRPELTGPNAHASKGEVKYQTLSDAITIIRRRTDRQRAIASGPVDLKWPVSYNRCTSIIFIEEH